MRPEVSLLCIYLVIFLYDLISTGHYRRMFHPLVCISTLVLVVLTLSDRSSFTLNTLSKKCLCICLIKLVLSCTWHSYIKSLDVCDLPRTCVLVILS